MGNNPSQTLQKIGETPLSAELRQEKEVIEAIHRPKIKSAQDEEIKAVLKYCFALIGLRPEQWPDELQKMVLLNFLRENYSGHSLEEIKLAFDLGVAGKFNLEMAHYQNFSCIYLGSAMRAYQKYAAQVLNQERNRYQEVLSEPLPSPEQQEMDDKLFANEYYRKYLNYEFSAVSLEYAHWVYDTLDRFKLIRYTVAEKKQYMEEAELIRQKEIHAPPVDFHKHKEMNKLIEAYINNLVPESEKQLVKQYAKRLALMDLFKKWKEQGRNRIFD